MQIFTVPNGNAGKLEGRSSFARLGLSIHCTGDFINPGWRGRMPLQIINHGLVPVVLTPYMDICQLLILKTTDASEKPYGAADLESKYMNEEGEPSRYWMDVRMRKLREACGRVNISDHILEEFKKILGKKDVTILDRFAVFLGQQPQTQLTNAGEIIERFADSERRSKKRFAQKQTFFKWFPPLLISTSIGSLFKAPYTSLHVALWILAFLLFFPMFYFMFLVEEPGEYLLKTEPQG